MMYVLFLLKQQSHNSGFYEESSLFVISSHFAYINIYHSPLKWRLHHRGGIGRFVLSNVFITEGISAVL